MSIRQMASDMSRSIAILIKVLISILLFEAFTAILAVPILLHFQRMSKVSDYMFDALKLSQEGEYEKAISYLDKAIDYDPNHFRVQMLEIQPGYQRAQDLLKIIEENSKTTLNYIFTAKRYGIPERSQAF